MKRLLVLVAVFGLGYLAFRQVQPDLQRYLKLRSM